MFARRSFLTLMTIGAVAGAPALAAQAPGHPHHPRAWVMRREVHRFGRWERRRHFARRHWPRHWDGII